MPNVYEFKDFEGSSHRILIEMLRRFTPPGGTLLDLGASAGHLGAAVRDHFDRTIGFEYEVACIGSLHEIFNEAAIADLETIKRLPGGVDAIVLGDVLEHLRDPASLLRLVHDSIGAKGRAFISVPNIANITVRVGLLLGIFEYRDRGILDNTHLRFYTMRTIRRQIESAGFRILAVRGSSVPVRLIVGKWMPEPLLRLGEWILTFVTRLWKSLFAYQIIIVAAPR
jgi:2-polyprenyl-3-methyl-5-hydroxy-6-metoxy-1,4-benzoquinol methylase